MRNGALACIRTNSRRGRARAAMGHKPTARVNCQFTRARQSAIRRVASSRRGCLAERPEKREYKIGKIRSVLPVNRRISFRLSTDKVAKPRQADYPREDH